VANPKIDPSLLIILLNRIEKSHILQKIHVEKEIIQGNLNIIKQLSCCKKKMCLNHMGD